MNTLGGNSLSPVITLSRVSIGWRVKVPDKKKAKAIIIRMVSNNNIHLNMLAAVMVVEIINNDIHLVKTLAGKIMVSATGPNREGEGANELERLIALTKTTAMVLVDAQGPTLLMKRRQKRSVKITNNSKRPSKFKT